MTRAIDLGIWAFVALLLVGCQVVAVLSRYRFGGFSRLMDKLTRTTPRMLVIFVGWMWLGWHFFAR